MLTASQHKPEGVAQQSLGWGWLQLANDALPDQFSYIPAPMNHKSKIFYISF
jgi:hypothetical protein